MPSDSRSDGDVRAPDRDSIPDAYMCDGCGKVVSDRTGTVPERCQDCGGPFIRPTQEDLACDRCGGDGASRVLGPTDYNRLCPDCVEAVNQDDGLRTDGGSRQETGAAQTPMVKAIGISEEKHQQSLSEVEVPDYLVDTYGDERSARISSELAKVSDWCHLITQGESSTVPSERAPPVTEFREGVCAVLNRLLADGYSVQEIVDDVDTVDQMLADQSADDVMDWCRRQEGLDAE